MFSAARNFCSSAMFLISFYSRTDVWEELDDYPKVIQSILTLAKTVRSSEAALSCFSSVSRCLVSCFEATSVFEYDIIFDGKRERVLQIEVAFSSSCFRKIMFGFTYLWWGCDYYGDLRILMEHSNTYICV